MYYIPKQITNFIIGIVKYKKIMIFSKHRLCIHEAGHIIITKSNPPMGLTKIIAEISSDFTRPGRTRLFGKINIEDKDTALRVVKILLSGRLAEKMFFLFPSTLSEADMQTARSIWENKFKESHPSWSDFYHGIEQELSNTLQKQKKEIKQVAKLLAKQRCITMEPNHAFS